MRATPERERSVNERGFADGGVQVRMFVNTRAKATGHMPTEEWIRSDQSWINGEVGLLATAEQQRLDRHPGILPVSLTS